MAETPSVASALQTALILGAGLLGWEVLARTLLADAYVLAPPSRILVALWTDATLYGRNLAATLATAAKGFVLGNLAAIAAAALIVAAPRLEKGLFSIALAIYALPVIALAPILIVLLDRSEAMVAMSALAVVFPTLVATALGLRSADPAALAVVHTLGGGGVQRFLRVRLPSALPSLFAGLKVAAPAAVLGATVGEFMGAERGLGVLITDALSGLEPVRVWTVATVATAASAGGYLLVGAVGAALTPWRRGLSIVQAAGPMDEGGRGAGRAGRMALTVAINLAVVIGGWALFIRFAGLNPFFAKGPADVWDFLFGATATAEARELVFGGLAVTLLHAGLGFAAGMTAGTLAAVVFLIWPPVERAAMPLAIALRSIPILATTPLVILLFGRGLAATTAIVAILSFFPTLINMVLAMRLTRPQIVDVLKVMNASRLQILIRAELPSALPALMASARVAVPASVLGAVVIEWLVTGTGMGNAILAGVYNASYVVLWAVASVLTLVSMAAYGLIALGERAVLRRYAPEQLA